MEKIKKILGMTLIVAVLLSGVQFAAQPSASASEPLSDSNEVPAITVDEPTSVVLETPLEGEAIELKSAGEPRGAWIGYTEDFEGAWPDSDWTVFDNDSPPSLHGEYYWGATTCYDFGASGDNDAVPHCDGASAMYTCWQPYPANLNSWMVWGPFDLTGFITADVRFDLNLHSEFDHDYFKCMASINGTNFYGYQTSGDTGGWVTRNFDLNNVPTLGNVAGQPQVWIAFVFRSDHISDSYAGPWMDDIILEASSEPLLNYITTADNENNYHTGTPDGDMYPANTDCIYNEHYKPDCPDPAYQNPLAPIEFNIFIPVVPSFTTAQLSLYAWDVDEEGDPANPSRPKERDEVYLNGHFVGTLTGANQVWSTSPFNVNPSWVQQGNNLVEVKIDVYNGCWCVKIDWGQLVLGGGGGQAFIRSWGPLMDCWPPDSQQHVMVEVDTSLSSQDVIVEINVLDAQNQNLIGTSQTNTIHGSQDDDFLFLLDVPATAATGYYKLEVIVYDAHTYIQQDYAYKTVEINPACAPPSPCTVHLESSQDTHATSNKGTITFHGTSYSLPDDASVGQGSYYATYYPESGYEFVRWETSGNVSVSDAYSQTTTVYVDCGGTLTAIYKIEAEWYYKPGYSDYAPSGIPDFDQKQDEWRNPDNLNWSYCGPLAVANCLWWFDSKMEPYPIPPPTINDNYPLLQSYSPGQWDDHDPWNLPYFVEDLAWRMDCDGQRTGGIWEGTYVTDMYNAILGYLADHGLAGSYEVTMIQQPTFEWVAAEVGRCEDVILLLGFWTWDGYEWSRVGGHYVTMAGVDPVGEMIAFSDPFNDRAEAGWPGRVLDGTLIPHSPVPGHDSSVHNDAGNISHDSYHAVSTDSPGGTWGPAAYAGGYHEIKGFFGQNFPRDFPQEFRPKKELPDYAGTAIQTEVEYAIAISPSAVPVCAVELGSAQDNGATFNKGSITFDGTPYSLSKDIWVNPSTYIATYTAAPGYEFVRWDAERDVSVWPTDFPTTEVTVSCGGELTAIYKETAAPPPCTVEGNKKAHPDQVEPGGETMVLITLHGGKDCPTIEEHADVMLVIDRSGSMEGTPLQDAKNAAKAFVDRLDLSPGADKVGLVSYADSATTPPDHLLSRMAGTVRSAINGLVSGGYTNITDGINKAQAELESSRHVPDNRPVIILMTDGVHNVGAGPGPAADAAKAKGTRIFTIGLGSVDAAQLQSLASSPSDYYYAATSDELDYIYQQIAGSLMGAPASNITLVDRLSDDVTYIAGSAWPVPYSISPDNKVLTWKIPSLGRDQTKTFRYNVRMSQTAQGVVCINESTTATYTDSNGHTATLDIPPACVTVKHQYHDCYCKDHDGDDGSVPSNPNGEAWWESPDIWVRHQQDGVEQHQNPEGCQINYVYAKVRNRGNTTMTNIEVDLYWSDGAVAIVWPGGWTYIDRATISSLAPGQVRVVNVPWHPLVSGHYCFLERIEQLTQDPVRHEGLVPFDNNLCQKNIQVIETTEEGWSDNEVTVRNPQDNSVQTDVTIDSSNYPPDGTVIVDVDPDVFDRWQDNGGDLQGGQVIPGTTSMQLDVSPTGEVAATIGRIPLDASEETTMELTLQVGQQTSSKAGDQAGIEPKLDAAGSKAKVGVRQIIEGEDVGGSLYGPQAEANPVAEGLENIMDKLEVVYGFYDGMWTWYNPAWPAAANTLTTLYVGRGYWVNVNQACNLSYGANSYQLVAGWNLIGWLGYWEEVGDNPDVAIGLASIGDWLEVVYGFDNGSKTWKWYNPSWPPAANTLETLYMGSGYWVDVCCGCRLEYDTNTYGLDVGWNLIGWLG